jgi:hypothetical protein
MRMHRVAWLLVSISVLGGVFYYRNHAVQAGLHAAEQPQAEEPKPEAENLAPDKDKMVKFVGPLADYMQQSESDKSQEKPARPMPLGKPNASDLIGYSPVGTTADIVHKTFAVSPASNFAFQVPPHAASPQLHGTYHSFVPASAAQSDDDPGDVDFLLLDEQQYADYLHGHLADVVYSVESSHDQDVSFSLPATLDKPAQYYLVFRNVSGSRNKKAVKANFRIDF